MAFGGKEARQFAATAVHAPIDLCNEVVNLSASSWKAYPLNVTYNGQVDIAVEVIRGNPVDIFVVDQTEMQRLKDGAEYRQFTDFEAIESKTYRRVSHLSLGTYYLVLRDKTLGILSENSSDIKVFARLGP